MQIQEIVKAQRKFFDTTNTRSVAFRIHYLTKLRKNIHLMETEILEALNADLGKSSYEGFLAEVGMVLDEARYMLKNTPALAARRPVKTSLAQLPAFSMVVPEPYGVVLIMSPWNYPFLLSLSPLIDAVAAGNTVILKPSNYSPTTSACIKKLINRTFPAEYVTVIEGGRDVNQELLDQKYDYIFFTGGKTVGELVMQKASKHLTPVSLELGGKSPCIVDSTADLRLAAKRIVFGKYLNVGQTCIAPDYLLVQNSVKEPLLKLICREITRQFGENPLANPDYGKIINDKHFNRLLGLIKNEKIITGGETGENNRIAPTVLDNITLSSPVMQEEIFGPILPVLTFDNFDEITGIIENNPTPLALYLFSRNRMHIDKVLEEIQFGGGCINDTITHIATPHMGFGGVGTSGMGSYHGKAGFDTFTHYKSVLRKFRLDIPGRYQPYSQFLLKFMKMLFK